MSSTSNDTVNLLNLGSAPLTISSITLGGTNAADFTLSSTCAAGSAIPQKVGNFRPIQIAFHPTATGPRAAAINVTLTNSTPVTLNMTGTGLAADQHIATSTAPIIWGGATPIGSSAAPVPIVVQNAGARTLTINSFSFGGANPGDFLFTVANRGFGNCFAGIPLAPLSFCSIGVNLAATITFTDANNATFSYGINGVSGSKTITRVAF